MACVHRLGATPGPRQLPARQSTPPAVQRTCLPPRRKLIGLPHPKAVPKPIGTSHGKGAGLDLKTLFIACGGVWTDVLTRETELFSWRNEDMYNLGIWTRGKHNQQCGPRECTGLSSLALSSTLCVCVCVCVSE